MEDEHIQSWLSDNILPWIAQILLAGVGLLAYWGISAKIEDTASEVCGCRELIRSNARHIRRLIEQHDEVKSNGNLPLDIGGSSGSLDPLDTPADGRDQQRYCATRVDTGDCRLGTWAKIYAERRQHRDDG